MNSQRGNIAYRSAPRLQTDGQVVFPDFRLPPNLGDIVTRILLSLFSMVIRIFALTFLWIYFDSKTVVLLVTMLVINFSLCYKLEYNNGWKKKNGPRMFSIWMTSFINIFTPCWYYRHSSDLKSSHHTEVLHKLAVLSLPCNLLITVWLLVCYALINWTGRQVSDV